MPFVFAMYLAVANVGAKCSPPGGHSARLQWSTPSKAASPNGRWEIQVRPHLKAKNNNTPVFLVDCMNGLSRQIMLLSRSADVTWGGNGNQIAIVEEPAAGQATFQVFELGKKQNRIILPAISAIKKSISVLANKQLNNGESTLFKFFKTFSFKGNQLGLRLSGVAGRDGDGKARPFCAEAIIDTQNGKILSSTSLTTNDSNISDKCTYFP